MKKPVSIGRSKQMTDTFPGMIPLGYFIVRKSGKKPRPFWITPDYLTVAGCLCEGVIPGIESVPFDDGKKEEIRREWDLPSREARRAATCHGRGGRPCRRKAPRPYAAGRRHGAGRRPWTVTAGRRYCPPHPPCTR